MDYFGVDRAAEARANAPRPAAPTFEDALLTIPSADELYAGVDPRAREDRLEKRVEPAVAAPRENDDSLEVASLASHFGPRLVVGETTRREAEDDVPATDSVMAEEDVAGDAALAVPADIVSVEADIVVASAPVAAGPETELTELLRSFAAELEALAAAWHAA